MRKALIATIAIGVAAIGVSNGYVAGKVKANSPIQHVVVLYQENHSFDNLLGNWCATTGHCIGMPSTVTLKGGHLVVPRQAPTIVPQENHSVAAQAAAIDGGLMDGWASVTGCGAPVYSCVNYYAPLQIPNTIALATKFAISDMTFSEADSPSWGGHLYAVAATTDGFGGNNPGPSNAGPGWGCDSNKTTQWISTTGVVSIQPSCVPDPNLGLVNGGAFMPTLAQYTPTIMDRLDSAGLSWRIYATNVSDPLNLTNSYVWATCPSFAECLNTPQKQNLVPTAQVMSDAQAGTLPAFSLVLPGLGAPSGGGSQHNGQSMTLGDNWIGKLTAALEASPNWSSTALFITYDDCGCFYDQVPPGKNPDGTQEGTRVPLLIVSPYAIPGYVDSTPTTFAGILAFVEQTFALTPLNVNDAAAYAFGNAFNYSQVPLAPIPMTQRPVSRADYAASQVSNDDPT